MSTKERPKYRFVGPATWDLIRAAYLAGESAPALAERYGVSTHAIRKRATQGHWTKRDYAAALEARGIEAPKPSGAKLNIAERYAANFTPREPAPVSAEPAAEVADMLEQRALVQVGEALAKGRAADAKSLAALAEQMRKRAAEERQALAAKVEQEQLGAEQREHQVMELFGRVAQLALALLHQPTAAPAVFLRQIKRWREINLGEGEADAEARAAKIAASHAHYLSGAVENTMPEDVRAYMSQRWEETRARL